MNVDKTGRTMLNVRALIHELLQFNLNDPVGLVIKDINASDFDFDVECTLRRVYVDMATYHVMLEGTASE